MPQNIVVGDDAERSPQFVADYAGTEVEDSPRPSPDVRREAETGQDIASGRLGAERSAGGSGGSGDQSGAVRACSTCRRIREDPAPVRAALARVGAAGDLDRLLELDARRRELLPEVEGLRAERNEASDAIGAAKREGGDADEAIARMREVSARIKALEAELETVEADRAGLAATIPNPPDPDAPDGDTDEDAVVLREVGERPRFGFEVRDHLDIGRALGLIETEKAAAASGSRFAYLIGDLVLVELALIRFAVEAARRGGVHAGRPAGARPRGARCTAPASSPASGR